MKLKETINKPLEIGIFFNLSKMFDWLTDDNTPTLNMSYYLGHSGEKEITPLYENLLNEYSSEEALSYLSSLVYITYGSNWNKIYETLNVEYNPIHNYNMEEKISTNTNMITSNKGVSSVNDSSSNHTNNTTFNENNNQENYFGFNSSSSSPTNENKGNEKNSLEGDMTNKSTSDREESIENNVKGSEEDNYQKTIKSGNIGVTTTQKMINEELEIRKNIFFERVMNDIDKLLTLCIY